MAWAAQGSSGDEAEKNFRGVHYMGADKFGHVQDIDVMGTKGSLTASAYRSYIKVFKYEIRKNYFMPYMKRNEHMRDINYHTRAHDTATEYRDVIRRVIRGLAPFISPEDSLKTMAVCFAAEESAMKGSIPVKVKY